MTAEDEAKLILKQHADSTRISVWKHCPNNFSSPNYITRNGAAGSIGYSGRNRGKGGYEGR